MHTNIQFPSIFSRQTTLILTSTQRLLYEKPGIKVIITWKILGMSNRVLPIPASKILVKEMSPGT